MARRISTTHILYLICVIGIIASGFYLLSSTAAFRKAPSQKQSLGFIKPMGQDIRIRGEEELTWSRVVGEEKVFQRDRVFTGVGSTANVNLRSKNKFTIEPNSLVVISDGEDPNIDLESGSFLGQFKKGAQIFLKSQGQSTKIISNGATFRMESKKGDKNLKLIVLSGEVTVQASDVLQPQKVRANEEVEVSRNISLKKLPIFLKAPSPGSVLWNREEFVKFEWTNSASKGATSVVEVANDPLFSHPVRLEKTNEEFISLKLPTDQVYFWRVTTDGDPSSRSPTSSFSYISLPVVTPREPASPPSPRKVLGKAAFEKNNYNFELTENGLDSASLPKDFVQTPNPVFQWIPAENAEKHTVEVSYYEDFRGVKEFTLPEGSWVWSNPGWGIFYARIRAQRESEVSYSDSAKIRILLAPPKFSSLQLKTSSREAPELQAELETDSRAEKIEFQMALNEGFSRPVSVMTESSSLRKKMAKAGSYFIRARHLDDQGWPISRFSKIQKIQVKTWIPIRVLAAAPAPEIKEMAPQKAPPEPVEVEVPAAIVPQVSEGPRKPYLRLWAGLGANYLKFSQMSGSELESGSFAKLSLPTYTLGANIRLSEISSLQFEFTDRPGQITNSGKVQIDRTQFDYRSISGEYQRKLFERSRISYSVLLGIQIHQSPFLNQNADDSTSLLSNETRNLSVGLKANYEATADLEYEIFMRYQMTLSSQSLTGDEFHARSGTTFDGSLGVSKKFLENFRLGLFWLGQSQNMNYDFTHDGEQSSGSQTFFNSNIQVRGEYGF